MSFLLTPFLGPFQRWFAGSLERVMGAETHDTQRFTSTAVAPGPTGTGGAPSSSSSAVPTTKGFKSQYIVKLRHPKNDEEAQKLYNHVRTVAFYLDAVPVLGKRLPFNVGVESIVGLIPGFGDLAGLLLGLYFVFVCSLFGLPWAVLGMMLFHVLLDTLFGIVPIVGDALDVAFKSNLRNLRVLEDHLESTSGKCGAGHFNLVFPPSNQYRPKDPIVEAPEPVAAPGSKPSARYRRRW